MLCLYLRYFLTYRVHQISIEKLRIWGFWKYVILCEKNLPSLSVSQNEKINRNPVLACSHRKIKKYGSKWKFMILKILFLNSPFFSDMIVFLVWENWSDNTDFTAQTIFFVPSFSTFFWWMTLYYFGCISVIFRAINFVRYTYESLDFEDSKNMWFLPKKHSPSLNISQKKN